MFSVIRSPLFSSKATPVRLACLMLASSLAGCSMFDGMFSSSKVDYRAAAKQTGGLEVPPDLTQLARDNRNQVQGGAISASAFQQAASAKTAGATPTAAPGAPIAPNSDGDLRIERDGQTRWLHSSLPPEQLWPQLRAFWTERGFELNREVPDIGVMETNWNENRAKLPQDIIRATVGKLFDGLYSTGERDMFRTRIERNDKGGTDIYISHRGMQEVYTNTQKENTAWQPRPSDPQLEGEMLSRLMLKLGAKDEVAKAEVAATAPVAVATATPQGPQKARQLSEVPNELVVNEGFERAWRRVAQSLDRHGFTVEDRDRNQGLFFLRYADPNQAGKEEPNFFQRLFGAESLQAAGRYRVSVKSEGERSTVKVLDDKGQQQTNENAKRILNLLMDDLR
jgi:outer membrane protein assembly factor BamC